MSPPTIRDEVLAAWRRILLGENADPHTVDVLVLRLEQACEGHGARLPRRPRAEDPNAVALAPLPAPGNYPAGATAARRAHRATLICRRLEVTADELDLLEVASLHRIYRRPNDAAWWCSGQTISNRIHPLLERGLALEGELDADGFSHLILSPVGQGAVNELTGTTSAPSPDTEEPECPNP